MLTPVERRRLAHRVLDQGNAPPDALALAGYAVERIAREADRMVRFFDAEARGCPDGLMLQALIKPVGDRCNLRCRYCFADNAAATPTMSVEVLEAIIAGALALCPAGVRFSFHGGEALLAGIEFFRLALQLQALHARPGQIVSNSVQTNATLLDREWAGFFAAHGFDVGTSVDGPPGAHDALRVDGAGGGSMARVAAGIRAAQAAGLEVTAISVVTCPPLVPPQELHDAMASLGVRQWRVNPCRAPGTVACYGAYVEGICDRWLAAGCGARIAIIDETLGAALGYRPSTCWMSGGCLRHIGFDPDGTVSPCCEIPLDPRYHFGNVLDAPFPEILHGERAREFWSLRDQGDQHCAGCEWTDYCGGGCTYLRIGASGSPAGQDYLCDAYRGAFRRLLTRFDRALLWGAAGAS